LPPSLRAAVVAALLYGVLACVPKPGPPVQDMAVDAAAPGAVGAACVRNSDCRTGLCFVDNFYNRADHVTAPSGYCSLNCARDPDCAPYGGVCIPFSDGSICLKPCAAAADCRAGYACWTFLPNVCYSADRLDCDPTAAMGGGCVVAGKPGGCIRQSLGSGKTGICQEGCTVAPDTCANDVGGARACVVVDRTLDAKGAPTGDGFKGTVCVSVVSNPGPVADGAECLYPSTDGTLAHFSDVCARGDECYLQGPPGQGFSTSGDNKCHRLCAPGSCAAPDTCRDAFGLLASANPVGLCLP
jgi:hypothetical protein